MLLPPTDDFTALVLHLLAHLRLAGPGNSYDRRYVAWVRAHATPQHVEVLGEGAQALEAAWGEPTPMLVHAWPQLLDSIAALLEHGPAGLAALAPEHARAPAILRALGRLEPAPVRRMHALTLELAPEFARLHRQRVEPELLEAARSLEPWWEPALAVLPSLEGSRVELAHALGPRGRVYGDRIVVGAPVPWTGMDPRISVVLLLHERAVHDSAHPEHALAEWEALTGLSVRMREAPAALQQAHAAWLASLELAPLLEALRDRGRIHAAIHDRLLRSPEHRAPCLASLADA